MTTWDYSNKSSGDVIYFTSESGDYYLVGSGGDELLVAKDAIQWNFNNKS